MLLSISEFSEMCQLPTQTLVRGGFADDATTSRVLAAAHELIRTAESCGATVTGVPWKAYALETKEQKKKSMTREARTGR